MSRYNSGNIGHFSLLYLYLFFFYFFYFVIHFVIYFVIHFVIHFSEASHIEYINLAWKYPRNTGRVTASNAATPVRIARLPRDPPEVISLLNAPANTITNITKLITAKM